MAENIVKFVLEKLVDGAVKEVLRIHRIDEQVEKVRRDLERIQAFLKDADKKHISDERQKHWIKEVRDVAHLIEDVIDTFLLEVPQKPTRSTGTRKTIKRWFKKTKKLPAVYKLVDEIKQIQTRLEEIKVSRETLGTNNLGDGTGEIILPVRPPVIPDVDPNVVGFKKDQDHVVNLLLNKNVKRRFVVSIWGIGGLGKTTLAQKVYNRDDIKTQFELRIWVDISQKFELVDILRKIGEQLNQSNTDGSPRKLHESLRGKKYFIVLDDVWTNDLWTQIGNALPDENNGSRVLLSTRHFNVAKHADPTCDPYELGLLTKELSLELLLKRALPDEDPTKIANYGLSDIIDQFVNKCNGLPIALVLLGSLLATKKPVNYATWSKVLRTMWFADGEKIIGTSYEDLQFALKSCFMYFAAFPEDYKIDAKDLLRMWIAEGFVPKEDERMLEETAESFLEDLVQRSMVQVTSRSDEDGSIKYCRIHDLLRDLALQKAKENNFLIVYSHPDDQHNVCMARRVAVHNSDCDELVMSQNLRTLLCFGTRGKPNCSKQRMLKVVRYSSAEIKLEMIEGLTQLRYLNFTKSKIPSLSRENSSLGEVIGNMMFLQTVAIENTDYPSLGLSSHKALRHVTGFNVTLPSPAKLPNLQTLDWVHSDKSWEAESWKTESPHVPNLRTLRLSYHSRSWEGFDTFLSTLKHLISLNLSSACKPFNGKLDMRGFPFYRSLQSLTLLIWASNVLIETPIYMPPHLTHLELRGFISLQDIMPALEKLQCLKKLWLQRIGTNEKMCCSSKGFSQLEDLTIFDLPDLKDWEIEEGAMPILRELYIAHTPHLCVPQGLRHLTNLQELSWSGLHSEPDRAAKENEIRNLCKHVPFVDLY